MENSEIIQRPKTESGYSEKKQAQQIEGVGTDSSLPVQNQQHPQALRKKQRTQTQTRRVLLDTKNAQRRDV